MICVVKAFTLWVYLLFNLSHFSFTLPEVKERRETRLNYSFILWVGYMLFLCSPCQLLGSLYLKRRWHGDRYSITLCHMDKQKLSTKIDAKGLWTNHTYRSGHVLPVSFSSSFMYINTRSYPLLSRFFSCKHFSC